MIGAIDYLRELRTTCFTHKGQCKDCPLGNQLKVTDTVCPHLIKPMMLTDEKTTEMVGIGRS